MANPTLARPRPLPILDQVRGIPLRALAWTGSLGAETVLVVALVGIGLVTHGLNMLNNPGQARFGDEGIYMEQAWAVLRQGRLSPYTYFYDHAPAGWILISVWLWLTGGPHTFGTAIDSGRVLMLLLHLAMIPLLYGVARKLGCSAVGAALATVPFLVSPLALFYQRLVLLDNIMLFWALLSLNLLLDGWGRLSQVILSGVCFGLAILSKETALFLLPAMLFIAFHQRWKHQGHFALIGWLLPMLMVVSWYPLFAAVKGELLPAGASLAFLIVGSTPVGHVSLAEAMQWQAARGGGGPLNLDNLFWQLLRTDWLPRDAALLVAGTVATVLNVLRGLRDRRSLAVGLLGLMPLLFLARGGFVLSFYVLVAIPFLCLNLGSLITPALSRVPARPAGILSVAAAALLLAGYWQGGRLQPLYAERPGEAARAATVWIKQHVPPESLIIMDDGPWTDLREPVFGGAVFPNAHSHWKVALDPAVQGGVFGNDWRTVDYLIMTPDLERSFVDANNTLASDALHHAHLVRRWEADSELVELWKVDKAGPTETALLAGSVAYLADHFERGGAYVDGDGRVTSEAQAYALLRAVWSDDRAEFDRVWTWTQTHLVQPNGLLAWLWQDGVVVDAHAASDADTDAALALLFAGRRWGDPTLVEAGTRLVQSIWEHEVAMVGGRPYLAAGDWATAAPVVALNPSYFSPYAYRIFQEVDPQRDWRGLIDAGYDALFATSATPLGAAQSTGLPPDWLGLDRASGRFVPLELDHRDTTRYAYDAPRTYWRVALDLRWSGDGRASAYLDQAGFLRDELARKGQISAVYARDGTVLEEAPSPVGTAGALAALLHVDPPAANALYAGQLVGGARRLGSALNWADANDLYAQEWCWFATALYADALPDLWHAR